MSLITIGNAGQEIGSTDYWDSEYALAGKCFVSINAGCIRLLIPELMFHIMPEIETGKKIIVSRGPWPAESRTNGLGMGCFTSQNVNTGTWTKSRV